MAVEPMRAGRVSYMQTWLGGAIAPQRVVWYPAPEGAKVFTDWCAFRSFNYDEQGWDSEGHREFRCNPDTWPGWGWRPDGVPEGGLGEVYSPCPPYYRGDDLWGYPGLHFCGTLETARFGGVPGVTPAIAVSADGGSACCQHPMGGPFAFGADASEEFFVATPTGVVSGVTPLLAAAKLTGTDGAPQTVAVNAAAVPVTSWGAPSVPSFPYDGYDKGGFWNASDPFTLRAPFDGIYRVEVSILVEAFGGPVAATIALYDPPGGLILASDTRFSDGATTTVLTPTLSQDFALGAGYALEVHINVEGGAGAPASVTIGSGTDCFSVRMLAPLDVHAGPTGVCNSYNVVKVVGPPAPAPCVTNPTSCFCPVFHSAEGPFGLAGQDFFVAGDAAEGPFGLAGDATAARGYRAEGPFGLAGDAGESFHINTYEGPFGLAGDG